MTPYDVITSRVVSLLEQGVVPWRKPWGGKQRWPRNLVSQRPYRGVNVFLTASAGYDSPFWLTFNQAKGLGGNVRKGEKGTPIVFWTKWERNDKESGERVEIPVLRYFTVFNAGQVEGVAVPQVDAPDRQHSPIAACEAIVAGMPNAPKVESHFDRAFYRPADDLVGLPPLRRFDSAEAFYSTAFHELTHATGHPSRLNRPGIADAVHFASDSYSREELVAEMGASFLSGHAGIETATLENSAAYLAGWLRVLKGDSKMVIQAAAAAQKAADFILGANDDAE